jgi:hypothetical protein
VYWAGSFFAEQDNSWHQASVRDSPFTASHIIEFYFTFWFREEFFGAPMHWSFVIGVNSRAIMTP